MVKQGDGKAQVRLAGVGTTVRYTPKEINGQRVAMVQARSPERDTVLELFVFWRSKDHGPHGYESQESLTAVPYDPHQRPGTWCHSEDMGGEG
jgi:hypothetical protein